MGDVDQLVEMGFDKERAELAVKKTGGLIASIEWLEKNQDKTLEEIKAEDAEEAGADVNISALQSEMQPRSLVCNECGKRFKNEALAQYHATKTEHTDFSESTEEIAPLTEEEKKARLEELRERLAAKKAVQVVQDKEDAKRNEQIRLKSTKETQDIKEELQRKEQIKEATRKRQEKADDVEAKRRILAKIAADKEERRRKAEEAKSGAGHSVVEPPSSETPQTKPAETSAPKPAASQARLRLQTGSGNIMKTLPAETTLFEVAQMLETETGNPVTKMTTTFPKKVYSGPLDFSKTLQEVGMVPSAAVIIE